MQNHRFFLIVQIYPHESRIICEDGIIAGEWQNVLKTFPTAETPGNDGIPIEFYNTFWPLPGDTFINSFKEAFMKKEMSPSQRQAAITLIEKQDKDRTYLENWRSISLTNIDAKIASKVIATRIVKVLPEIIHSNQTGYVSGRYIREAARSILDIMNYTKLIKIMSDHYNLKSVIKVLIQHLASLRISTVC